MKGKRKNLILLLAGTLFLTVTTVYAGEFTEEPLEPSAGFLAEEAEEEPVEAFQAEDLQKEAPLEGPEIPGADNDSSAGLSAVPETIPVDESYFPDAGFRRLILDKIDKDKDGKLTEKERLAVTGISTIGAEIYDLQGLGNFPNLEDLLCQCAVRELDLRENPKLIELNCYGSENLTKIDMSNCKQLEYLSGDENGVWDYLDLRDCTKLEIVSIGKVKKLDLRNNLSLWSLRIGVEAAPELSQCPVLRDAFISGSFPEIDVTQNPVLSRLWVTDNEEITSLDVSSVKTLEGLRISGSKNITSLDVSKNRKLRGIVASDSGLVDLYVGKNSRITQLYLDNCNMQTLDLTDYPKLEELSCNGMPLTSLDLSPCPRVSKVYCLNTGIKYLDLSTVNYVDEYYVDEDCQVLLIKEPKLKEARLKGTNQVTVTWEPVHGAYGYVVYRKNLEGEWERVKGGRQSDTSYTQRVVPGRSYTYTVMAYREVSLYKSTYSEEGVSTRSLLDTPKMESAVRSGKNRVEVSWEGVKGATKYRVYRRRAGGKVWKNLGDTRKTNFTDKKAPAGTTYCYTVKAYNEKTSPVQISWYQKGGITES